MENKDVVSGMGWVGILTIGLPLSMYWLILLLEIPLAVSQYFFSYSSGLFIIILVFYFIIFRLPGRYGTLAGLGFTMLIFALALSYKWTSGFSDNLIMGGLVPYKDGKNYYQGASLILNGLPPLDANQSTERPLFPSFFASTLFLTGQNLKIALAVTVQLAGVGIYLSARQFYKTYGALGAALLAALLFLYIQPWVGYVMSEMFGFTLGCWGFALIWSATNKPNWQPLILGTLLLMMAVSARAGTFFVFPMLALWIGWIRRGGKWFDLKMAVYALLGILLLYFLVNPVYSRALGIPPGSSFGNFSYALYGQARGGTGWHSAIEELGTRDPSVVYRATWEYFLKHPISLFIGFAKSYRDFFFIGDAGIFPFGKYGFQNIPGVILWLAAIFLLFLGFKQLIRDMHSNLSSLLLAFFLGIFLSIPFLPPIDGGSRFYASTMSFFFAIPAAGIASISNKIQNGSAAQVDLSEGVKISTSISIVLIFMTTIAPLMMVAFVRFPEPIQPICSSDQAPFVIETHPDSYLDLFQRGSLQCGSAPEVCFDDFERNNTELVTDDFYQELFRLSENGSVDVRIVPAIDWVDGKFHYFYIPRDMLPAGRGSGALAGCAIEIRTTFQSIFKVESVQPGSK